MKIELGEKTIVRAESEKSVTKQSEILTILERELETNVFDKFKENWGYLEYKIVFDATNPTARGKKLFLIQNLTFWSFYIFGFPITEIERTIEVDINIYDKNQVKLKKYNIVATSEPKSVGLPQTISGWDPEKLAGIDVTRDIIEQLKLQLETDIDYLNKELEAAGPLN